MNLLGVVVRRVMSTDEERFQFLMQKYHYLGCPRKISETLWYVARWQGRRVALLSFFAGSLETFVDPRRFRGTIYRAANRIHVGESRGFRRSGKGYSAGIHDPKMVFLKPLHPKAQELLCRPI